MMVDMLYSRIAVALATVALLAACSSPTAAPSPTAGPPTPAATGPVQFTLSWDNSNFSASTCPADHPTAFCYAGTADGTLPIVGHVQLQRRVYTGENTSGATTSPGCVTAVTDGTLTADNGATLAIHGVGELCGGLATYTLTSGTGTRSLTGVVLTGTITNDSGAEEWAGTVQQP
jgi:hypothetical protein